MGKLYDFFHKKEIEKEKTERERVIAAAKLKKLDFNSYAADDFDSRQLKEIYYGLLQRVSVDVYADPTTPPDVMAKLRKRMLIGMHIEEEEVQ